LYNIESLKDGKRRAKENIKTFEAAIKKERETIASYNHMIDVLERRKTEQENMIVEQVK